MKKITIIIQLSFIILILTACSEINTYSGNGENWIVEFHVKPSNDTGEYEATIKYIGPGEPPEVIGYYVAGNHGTSSGTKDYKDGILVASYICNNCHTIHKDDEIEVKITWGENEEKFTLLYKNK
ncbi:hypothetical protein [Sutcliffiella halmapala]|uniref:hypothetical protein n=1 Tax=Sutcliffiella halmapala TaxID=79882 RepID=UPI0009956999|nr:hypothetical protein [Sutcliffiella halmapala]